MTRGAMSRKRAALLAGGTLLASTDLAQGTEYEVIVGGSTEFGFTTAEHNLLSDGDGDRGYQFVMDNEIDITAGFLSASGIRYGSEIELELDLDLQDVEVDEVFLFFSGAFGRAELGATDGAEDSMALGADTVAVGTGGIDGDTVNLGEIGITTPDDAAKVTYFTPRVAGFQFGLSFTPDAGEDASDDDADDLEKYVGLGLNFVREFDDVDVGLALVGALGERKQRRSDCVTSFALGTTLGAEDLEFGASYGVNNDCASGFDFATIGVTYDFDLLEAGIGYNYVDFSDGRNTNVVVLSGEMEILPGVDILGDFSYNATSREKNTVASILSIQLDY